jgi:endonuclease/exonuclease/phosphatase (EEP) superfamily protein YafD
MSGPSTNATFAVMSFNVGNGLVPPRRLVAMLRQSGADIVGLQEVNAAQAAAVAREAVESYPYQAVRGSGFSGRGLLSRYPIVAHEWLELVPDRPDLRITVDLCGRPTAIVVAHPQPPRLRLRGMAFDTVTAAQIDRLALIAVTAAPAVLLGDFNMTPRHPAHARLRAAGLVDAQSVAGSRRGATFPLRPGRSRRWNHRLSWVPLLPVFRVDYVWHTGDLATLGAWVGRGAGSDHRPVLARLAPLNDASTDAS